MHGPGGGPAAAGGHAGPRPVVVVTRYPQGGVDLDIDFRDGRPVRRLRFRPGQRQHVDDTIRYLRARDAAITDAG